VSGAKSVATLSRVTVGPSTCLGVAADSDSIITLRRSLVVGNRLGGMELRDLSRYDIENTYIVENGSTSLNFGGLKLKPRDPSGSRFVNNTVAGNISRGGNADEMAVRCEATVTLINSLVFGNIIAQSGSPPQVGTNCRPSFCNIQNLPAPLSNSNINATPNFVGGGPPLSVAPWHLKSPSPCSGKGTAGGAPGVDYDGDPRAPVPAIGADEV
jgi:hypothetical protein